MIGPTYRQLEVLHMIACLTNELGYPPGLAELGRALGIRSNNCTHGHLRALRRKGLVDWRDHASRTLLITAEGWQRVGRETRGQFFQVLRCQRCEAQYVPGRGRCLCPKAERSAA